MKKIIIGIFSIILFIMMLSILIVGLGNKEKNIDISEKKSSKSNNNYNNQIKSTYSKEELNICVYITQEKKIETMNIEDYVVGVVSAEMPVEFEFEALKAQAVAARTYGLAHIETFGGAKIPKACGANVNNTTQFQVYMHKEDRMKLWSKRKRNEYWKKITRAVKETEGEILAYNGEIVRSPYYFSTSSGRTEDAVNVFSKDVPYLKSVDSPGEERSSKYITKSTFTYGNLSTILNKWNPKLNIKSNLLKKQLKVLEKSSSGSVIKIKAGDEYISGSKFRKILGLNSFNFDIKFNKKDITITCRGYGHGVGMSQWGAYAMAKKGAKYREILKHYYSGVEIVKLVTSD